MSLKVLLIGYGNPGRLDDGLGPACAAKMDELKLDNLTVDADYQLVVEDAADVAKYDVVIFADASLVGEGAFEFRKLTPCREINFSTHSVEPGEVLALAHEIFDARTRGYVLGIRGYEFNEFGEGLSDRAMRNLEKAVAFLEEAIREGTLAELGGPDAGENSEKTSVVFSITRGDLN